MNSPKEHNRAEPPEDESLLAPEELYQRVVRNLAAENIEEALRVGKLIQEPGLSRIARGQTEAVTRIMLLLAVGDERKAKEYAQNHLIDPDLVRQFARSGMRPGRPKTEKKKQEAPVRRITNATHIPKQDVAKLDSVRYLLATVLGQKEEHARANALFAEEVMKELDTIARNNWLRDGKPALTGPGSGRDQIFLIGACLERALVGDTGFISLRTLEKRTGYTAKNMSQTYRRLRDAPPPNWVWRLESSSQGIRLVRGVSIGMQSQKSHRVIDKK